jgi:alpha-L-rhamnosidase
MGQSARATLHATAHGIFEAYLNGQPVSDDVLSPGWTTLRSGDCRILQL